MFLGGRVTKKNNGAPDSKINNLFKSKYNKTALIFFEIALLFTVVVLICFVVKGNISLKQEDTTKYIVNNTTNGIVYKEGLTFAPTEKNEQGSKDKTDAQENNTQQGGSLNTPPIDNGSAQGGQSLPDPSGWSKAQIIAKAKDAVNKTKSFKGELIVNHSEGFTADVTQCTGGELVKSVVNLMIGWVVKPVEETLSFSNGKAVNSEGETVPVLLPKREAFSLAEGGVKKADVQRNADKYIIKFTLVEESVAMYDIPVHNAGAVGYLDVASFDISFMEVDSADIVYKGTSVELHINADGYVTYASYTIPLNIVGSAHKGSISGSATFDGEQTESWKINY